MSEEYNALVQRGRSALKTLKSATQANNKITLTDFRDKWLPYLYEYFKGDWVTKYEKGSAEYEQAQEVIVFWNHRENIDGHRVHPLADTEVIDNNEVVYIFPSTLSTQESVDYHLDIGSIINNAGRAPTPHMSLREAHQGIAPNLYRNTEEEGLTRFQVIDIIFQSEGLPSIFKEPSNSVVETKIQPESKADTSTGWQEDWEDEDEDIF